LIAEPFSWIHSSDGRVDDRKTWLEGAARGMALSGQRSARTEYGASLATHGEPAHTAVRIARVRLVNAEQKRESWIRQSHIWVRKSGQWQLIMGQGVGMYDGPPLDSRLHARYAGVYALEDGRKLTLVWQDGMLLATFPNGAQTQIFLASPTEEVVRNPLAGALRFTLDEHKNPRGVALVRANQEIWRANLSTKGDR
ncbi:MAG: hypothetical protein H7Y89_04500, partial [Steroidobacteraceae bacterium]|nr:hypothetical protein [Steroidobacteraceae bacterium]